MSKSQSPASDRGGLRRWDYQSALADPWALPSLLWAGAEILGGALMLGGVIFAGWAGMALLLALGVGAGQ